MFNLTGKQGIQTKFLLGLAAILTFFSALVSMTIYIYQREKLVDEAYQRAKLIMTAMEANRGYVRNVLRPRMYEIVGDDGFILEAMSSSYISRAVMEFVNNELEDFSYRRVSLNARNPQYEAVGMEKDMISFFNENPHVDEWYDVIKYKDGERVFMRFQPVIFTESCMHCHGRPEDAPHDIITTYGDKKGFRRKVGEVAGVISVGLPVGLDFFKIKELSFIVFSAVIPSLLLLYIVISLFFNKLVAQNLKVLLNVFRSNLPDEKGLALLEESQKCDEIEQLTDAAKTISAHMEKDKKQLEQYADEILSSKELLQSVFDGITDPVVLLDKEKKTIKIVNRAFLLRYDKQLDEVLGQSIFSSFQHQECPLALNVDLIDKVKDVPIEQEVLFKDGAIFLIYLYPVVDTHHEINDVVCYVKEITKQKKYEQQIQHTEKLVAIGQLAAGIAHEINNPLGVILCHIDLAKDDENLSDETRKDIKIIEKHVDHCKQIISDLLHFARQGKPSLSLTSINDLVAGAIEMVSNQFEMQGIHLSTELHNNIPKTLLDADKIRQVLLNLLLNSAQSIEGKEGQIRIKTRFEKQQIFLIIEDNGCGISQAVIDKIFDPFFTTKAPGKGTGLGLSVSYSIIQEHGGMLTVESDKDKQFTRFTIALPIKENNDEE